LDLVWEEWWKLKWNGAGPSHLESLLNYSRELRNEREGRREEWHVSFPGSSREFGYKLLEPRRRQTLERIPLEIHVCGSKFLKRSREEK